LGMFNPFAMPRSLARGSFSSSSIFIVFSHWGGVGWNEMKNCPEYIEQSGDVP
jgi:hypothetical protein